MHFTSTAVRWLVAGVADRAFTDAARSKTVREFILEAKAAGLELKPENVEIGDGLS